MALQTERRKTFAIETSRGAKMTDDAKPQTTQMPTLEDWQHWTYVMGRAQQMMMEYWDQNSAKEMPAFDWTKAIEAGGQAQDMTQLMSAGAQAWAKGLEAWGKMLGGVTAVPAPGSRPRQSPAPHCSAHIYRGTIA